MAGTTLDRSRPASACRARMCAASCRGWSPTTSTRWRRSAPLWAGLLTRAGQGAVRFHPLGGRRGRAGRLRGASGRGAGAAADALSAAPADRDRAGGEPLRSTGRRDGDEGAPIRACPRSAGAGSRPRTGAGGEGWLAHRLSLGVTEGRRRARLRQDALARMQRRRAERRQLRQGLLCRPGEYRADELAQKVNRRLVVVPADAPGPRTRIHYPDARPRRRASPDRRSRRRDHCRPGCARGDLEAPDPAHPGIVDSPSRRSARARCGSRSRRGG